MELHTLQLPPRCGRYRPLLEHIAELAQSGKTTIVAIDGRCGSGKTQLARLIGQVLPCNIFHMDDFYLPAERLRENWLDIPAGNMDLDRFLTEVLDPVRAGAAVSYVAYDCHSGLCRPTVSIPPQALNIVEGSYSHHPRLRDRYDERIFLTCDHEEQIRRLQARDPALFPRFESRWIPLEERYFQSCGVGGENALTIDTSGFFL